MSTVILAVRKRFLMELNPSASIGNTWGPAEQPIQNPTPFNPNDQTILRIISVELEYLQKFATTCEWLYHISFLVFKKPGFLWRGNNLVLGFHLLQAGEYIFSPIVQNQRSIYLARFFAPTKVKAPKPDPPSSVVKNDFDSVITLREKQRCLVSGLDKTNYPSVRSHLIPKRLGPVGVQNILRGYMENPPEWQNNGKRPDWDYRNGILLCKTFDFMVNGFRMGFYNHNKNNNVYLAHQLDHPNEPQTIGNAEGWSKLAIRWEKFSELQFNLTDQQVQDLNLHNSTITIHGTLLFEAPPWEVISWHYLQCVLREWAHAEYIAFENIEW